MISNPQSPTRNPQLKEGLRPTSVQPGGGFCMNLELAWGRFRRAYLRRFFPAHVEQMRQKRQGECPNCPHDIIDPRDLKYFRNVCGYWFRPEDDAFRWRDHVGFARVGLMELLFFSALCVVPTVVCVLLALTVHAAFWFLTVPFLLGLTEVLWFFRDPERPIPSDPAALISPADGTVTHIEEVDEPDFGRALRISIFLSVFNVHVNRMPRSGRVTEVRYFPGLFLDARNSECAVRNEQLWIDFEDAATGKPVRVKQISGAIARRIVCWLKPGDTPGRGERLGMIKFGSRTDVLLPVGLADTVDVKVGDSVKGGSSILLRLKAGS
jgi:phosphatidylserine decarboxylase